MQILFSNIALIALTAATTSASILV